MRHVPLIFVLLAALALPGSFVRAQQPAQQPPKQPAPGQQQGQIIVEVPLVNLVATVVNRRGKFVTDLSKDDFRVAEDGQAQQITHFSRETDLPLRIGLLLDTSNSVRDRIEFEKDAAIDFLHNVIRRRKDQAFLMTFDNEATLLHGFTDDLNTLQDIIRKQRAGGTTALYRGVFRACTDHLMKPPLPTGENKELRRILVVISDGEDADPTGPARSQAIEACQHAQVAVYAISTSTEWISVEGTTTPKKFHKTDGDQVLEQFSDETGGRAFFPYRRDDLAASFQDIGDELRSQYSLGYTPSNKRADGRFRRVELKVEGKNLKNLTVRTRKGYFATRDAAPTSPSSN